MDLHHVKAFLAVAEELHFGRAAARLHVAQPPLSRTIQQLERLVGAPLFSRTTRSVHLTPQGEALLQPARDIVAAFHSAERAVIYAGRGEIGRVSIGFAGPSSHSLVSALAQLVRREQPGIELALRSTTYGADAARDVQKRELDIAIVRVHVLPQGLASRIVRIDHYVVVVPTNHPFADRESLSMSDLRDEPWVLFHGASGSTLRDTILWKAQEAGFSPIVAQQAPDTWTIMALVAAGVGITMTVDSAFVAMSTEGLSLIPLDYGVESALAQLVWREDDRSPATRRVLDLSEVSLPTPSGVA